MKTLVVGAGIGGLTTAIALRHIGLDPVVIERTDAFRPVGAGITVQANAHAVLQALGVHFGPEDAVPIGQVEMITHTGRVLLSGDADEAGLGIASLNVHRADLSRILRSHLGETRVRLGTSLEGLREHEDGVNVDLSDGSRETFELVIGADGAGSTARRALLGEAGMGMRYAGYTCWRFAIEAPGLVPETTVERWSPGRRVGIVPLSRDRVYCFLVESAPQGTPGPGTSAPDAFRARFEGLDERLDPLLPLLQVHHVHHGDLGEHEQIHFGRGRVVLLGDAAHAMTPNMGQGAGMAIEDAAALALLIRDGAAPHELAEALAAARAERVGVISKTAWRIGAAAHWKNPVARWFRDLVLSSMPKSMSTRQIAQVLQPGVDLAEQLQAVA